MHRFCVTGSVLVGVVDNDSIPHRTPSQDGREEDDLHATIESQFTGWGFEEAMRRIAETNESHVATAPRLGSLYKPLFGRTRYFSGTARHSTRALSHR